MPPRLLLALPTLAVAACAQHAAPVPEVEGAPGRLLVTGLPGQDAIAYGLGPEGGSPRALTRARTVALAYSFATEALLIPAGAVVPSTRDGPELPPPEAAFSLDDDGGWAPVDPAALDLTGYGRPPVTVEACAALGGCATRAEGGLCRIPCDPEPPAPPALPARPCPTDWRREDVADGVFLCAPTWPDRVDCEPGTWQPFSSPSCEPLSVCPEGPWPPAPAGEGPLVFVAPGATGGDGSPEAPFGDLEAALATAGARILVGAGQLDVTGLALDTPEVTVAGLCPERTSLRLLGEPARVDAAGVRLLDLTLVAEDGDAIVVGASGALNLTRAQLIAPDGAAVRAEGSVTARAVRVVAQAGFRTMGGALDAQGLDVAAEAAVRCEGEATLRLVDGSLRGHLDAPESGGLVELEGCGRVTLERLHLVGTEGSAVLGARYWSLHGRDLAVRDAGRYAFDLEPNQTREAPTATTSLARLHVVRSAVGLRAAVADIEVEDAAFEAVLFEPMRIEGAAQDRVAGARVRGLWARDTGPALVARTRPGLEEGYPTLAEDLVVVAPHDTGPDEAVVRSAQRMPLELRRAWLEAGVGFGLGHLCGGPARFEDLTIGGQGRTGVRLEGAGEAELHRVSVIGRFQIGVERVRSDSCDPARAEATDLRLEQRDSGFGLRLEAGTGLSVERFVIRGHTVGVDLESDAPLELREGRVVDNRLAFDVPSRLRLHEILDGVTVEDNRQDVRRR